MKNNQSELLRTLKSKHVSLDLISHINNKNRTREQVSNRSRLIGEKNLIRECQKFVTKFLLVDQQLNALSNRLNGTTDKQTTVLRYNLD